MTLSIVLKKPAAAGFPRKKCDYFPIIGGFDMSMQYMRWLSLHCIVRAWK